MHTIILLSILLTVISAQQYWEHIDGDITSNTLPKGTTSPGGLYTPIMATEYGFILFGGWGVDKNGNIGNSYSGMLIIRSFE